MIRILTALSLLSISFSTLASDGIWPVPGFEQMMTDSRSSGDHAPPATETAVYVEPIPGFAKMIADQRPDSQKAGNLAQVNGQLARGQD